MAALRWSADNRLGPSFEDMDSADGDNFYEVTVTAFDGVASKSQAVNIEVTNQEEFGSVSLSQRVPAAGHSDNGQFERPGRRHNGRQVAVVQGRDQGPAAPLLTPGLNFSDIDGLVTIPRDRPGSPARLPPPTCAPSAPYLTPRHRRTRLLMDDARQPSLTARVTYTDALGAETNEARATSESNARERRDANAAPSFGDDESVDRSVEENAPKTNVGEPVAATDSDSGDLLLYTLSGDGSDAFKVDNNGQIKTKKKLGLRDAVELQRDADGYRPVRG